MFKRTVLIWLACQCKERFRGHLNEPQLLRAVKDAVDTVFRAVAYSSAFVGGGPRGDKPDHTANAQSAGQTEFAAIFDKSLGQLFGVAGSFIWPHACVLFRNSIKVQALLRRLNQKRSH